VTTRDRWWQGAVVIYVREFSGLDYYAMPEHEYVDAGDADRETVLALLRLCGRDEDTADVIAVIDGTMAAPDGSAVTQSLADWWGAHGPGLIYKPESAGGAYAACARLGLLVPSPPLPAPLPKSEMEQWVETQMAQPGAPRR
jgi:hypothetical protein